MEKRASTTDDPAPDRRAADEDDEQLDAALSRAAREAVRQPPDPRIEGLFANLASGPDRPAASPRAERSERDAEAVPPAPMSIDLEPLRETVDALRSSVEAWQGAAERAGRQLAVVSWALVAATVLLGIAALALLLRP